MVAFSFVSGLPETACGLGSTLESTRSVRAHLPGLLAELGVRVLLDAPCGDFNWLSWTDLSSVEYIGVDNDPVHLAAARARASEPAGYAPRRKTVRQLDLLTEALPDADLMLCRDFLQHIPNLAAEGVLARFRVSGIRWLLATCHDNPKNDDVSRMGGFRPLNLCAAPFSLPAPALALADGEGRTLALWDRTALQ